MNILFLLLIFVIKLLPASSNPESRDLTTKTRSISPSILIDPKKDITKKHLSDSAILANAIKEMCRTRSHSFYKKEELNIDKDKKQSTQLMQKSVSLSELSIDNSDDLQFHMED